MVLVVPDNCTNAAVTAERIAKGLRKEYDVWERLWTLGKKTPPYIFPKVIGMRQSDLYEAVESKSVLDKALLPL